MSDEPRFLWMEPIGPWRRWFAWYPVKSYDDEWLWFDWVERQRFQTKPHLPRSDSRCWIYRRADRLDSYP